MRALTRMITAASVPALVAALTFAVPEAGAAAAPARGLPCHASMSSYRPADYTTVTVRVRTASGAHVTTVAHYRTTSTVHHRRANASATPGYRVKVSVTVRKGRRKAGCQTAFTPHR